MPPVTRNIVVDLSNFLLSKVTCPCPFLVFICYLFTPVGVCAYDIRTDYKLLEGRNCVLFLWRPWHCISICWIMIVVIKHQSLLPLSLPSYLPAPSPPPVVGTCQDSALRPVVLEMKELYSLLITVLPGPIMCQSFQGPLGLEAVSADEEKWLQTHS